MNSDFLADDFIVESVMGAFATLPARQRDFVAEVVRYNALAGKRTRIHLTYLTCMVCNPEMNKVNAARLAYLNEILHASMVVFDDLMDNSDYRRDKACWHIHRGNLAMRDAYLLFSLCRKYLKFIKADATLGTFHEIAFKTTLGQTLDTIMPGLSRYEDMKLWHTMETYKAICLNKNAYYTFYHPVKLALLFCGAKEPASLKGFAEVCGYLHQIQDDYLNFFPEQSGKSGNDIEEKKLTWFLAKMIETDDGTDEVLARYFRDNEDTGMLQKNEALYTAFYAEEKGLVAILEKIPADDKFKCVYDMCIRMVTRRRR